MGKKQLSDRDLEQISAYLDGELSSKDKARVDKFLWSDPEWRSALDEMDRVRTMLRTLPRKRAPRNFTLSPEYARQKSTPRLYPAFGFASAITLVCLLAAFVGDWIGLGQPSSAIAQTPLPQTTAAALLFESPTADASAEISAPSEPPSGALKMPATPILENSPEASPTSLPSETPTETTESMPQATTTLEVIASANTATPLTTERETTNDVKSTASSTPSPTDTEMPTPTSLPTETQTTEPTSTSLPTITKTVLPPTHTFTPTDTAMPEISMQAEPAQSAIPTGVMPPTQENTLPGTSNQIGDQPIWMIIQAGLLFFTAAMALAAWWNYRHR